MAGASRTGGFESGALLAKIHLGNPKKMACFLCVLYIILVKPHLSSMGVVCSHYGDGDELLFKLVDYVFIGGVLCIVFVVIVGCAVSEFLRPSQAFMLRKIYVVIVWLLLAASMASMVQLSAAQGMCGLGEPLRFGVPLGLLMLAAPNVHLFLRRHTFSKVLWSLKTVAWTQAEQEKQEATLETGCAICLCNWEQDDEIKVTHCKHAFHTKCLRRWLVTQARDSCRYSCALCRQELAPESHMGPQTRQKSSRAWRFWRLMSHSGTAGASAADGGAAADAWTLLSVGMSRPALPLPSF